MKSWEDEGWRAEMRIAYDYNYMMAEFVGETDGVTEAELDSLVPRAKEIHKDISSKRKAGEIPFLDLPYQDTAPIKTLADEIVGAFDNFVLLGIGGSALGPIALQGALRHPLYNMLTRKGRGGRPRMFFLDNVDPDHVMGVLDFLDVRKTVFAVVTKSGGTAETMAQYMLARGMMEKRLGKEAAGRHFVAVTDPEKGNLRKILKTEGYRSLDVPPGVGGRFSVFTPVGLLPAAVSGIDIGELLAGAADMDARTRIEGLRENPAYMAGALQYLANTAKGKRMSVMMPYSQGLRDTADWYRQLWAESLGKKRDVNGTVVSVGQTPIKALGATDQHSQVQLYMEGPNDKTFTFARVERFDKEAVVPGMFADMEGVGYLGGRGLGELINAEQTATETALMAAGRPSARITLPSLNAFTLGQTLYMLEVETAFAGGLYNINPFDQPGVEEGKLLTYAMMGRPGYEARKKAVEGMKQRLARYMI